MSATLFLAAAGLAGGFALYRHDQNVLKRMETDLPYLQTLKSDAESAAVSASDKGTFMVRSTEKQIFQSVVRDASSLMKGIERYRTSYPVIRAILAPPPAKEFMTYSMWCIFYYEDGDFYDSFIDFWDKH
jgi:hypothetical protein